MEENELNNNNFKQMKRTGQKRKAQHDDDKPIKKARKIEDSIQALGHYDDVDNFESMDSDQDRENGDNSNDDNGFEDLQIEEDGEGAQYDDDDDMPDLADISNGKLNEGLGVATDVVQMSLLIWERIRTERRRRIRSQSCLRATRSAC